MLPQSAMQGLIVGSMLKYAETPVLKVEADVDFESLVDKILRNDSAGAADLTNVPTGINSLEGAAKLHDEQSNALQGIQRLTTPSISQKSEAPARLPFSAKEDVSEESPGVPRNFNEEIAAAEEIAKRYAPADEGERQVEQYVNRILTVPKLRAFAARLQRVHSDVTGKQTASAPELVDYYSACMSDMLETTIPAASLITLRRLPENDVVRATLIADVGQDSLHKFTMNSLVNYLTSKESYPDIPLRTKELWDTIMHEEGTKVTRVLSRIQWYIFTKYLRAFFDYAKSGTQPGSTAELKRYLDVLAGQELPQGEELKSQMDEIVNDALRRDEEGFFYGSKITDDVKQLAWAMRAAKRATERTMRNVLTAAFSAGKS